MTSYRTWHSGLQLERTNLAWRRTALVVFGLGLAAPRLAWENVGGWSLLISGAVAAGALALFAGAGRRYTRAREVLLAGEGLLPDGRLVLLACVLTALLAGFGVVIVVGHLLT